MHLESILEYLINYRYYLIIPLTIVEGPIVMVLCGFLLRLGTFELLPLYGALTLGDLIGDVIWYCIGRFWGIHFVRKFGKFFSITEANLQRGTELFQRHHNKILFISKITMGFGLALVTLITAGMAKVPFRKYMVLNFSGQLIWTGVLLSVGYLFGHLYTSIDKGFRDVALIGIGLLVIVLIYGFGKFIATRFGKAL
jgi:membrane-associated protein